ncbi:MAG: polyhydroxyalkanoate depolymerase, partial [Pseudomonadota bacterium]
MNPVKESMTMSSLAALCDLFEATTRRYDKPAWNLKNTEIADGEFARVVVKNKRTKPFCDLLHFKRNHNLLKNRKDPKVLILAPMAGHHATLLRGTVEALIPDHDVYITDWRDARIVPLM